MPTNHPDGFVEIAFAEVRELQCELRELTGAGVDVTVSRPAVAFDRFPGP